MIVWVIDGVGTLTGSVMVMVMASVVKVLVLRSLTSFLLNFI